MIRTANNTLAWKAIGILTFGFVDLGLLLIAEAMLAMEWQTDTFINPARNAVCYSKNGPPLLYVVMGDSTAAGRGASYGIAAETAKYLSQSAAVTMVNLGISGAKLADVVREELPAAIKLKPDLVLLSIGANDVTNFTSNCDIKASLDTILDGLAHSNANVRIVVTGSADLGAVPRFLQPLRWLAGQETERVNEVMEPLTKSHGAIWTPLAKQTGPFFKKDPSLFAADKFPPNDRGYAIWCPFLHAALDTARQNHR